MAARPAPPAPSKSQNQNGAPSSSDQRRREREREQQRREQADNNDASSVSTAGAVAHDDGYNRPAPPARKESITQLTNATNKMQISDDSQSTPTKAPGLSKKPAVIGAKDLDNAPTEVILTTKERLPNGKEVEEKTVIAPAQLEGPAAAAAALEKPYQPPNVRYSTMTEEQIMWKLREIVNKDDPKNSYSMIKKIGQGYAFFFRLCRVSC